MNKIVVIAVLISALFTTRAAVADSQEDFVNGYAAYQEGDLIRAMSLLKKAADDGHAAAQAGFAYILDKSDEDEEAVRYYRLSAEQGHVDGMYGLGSMYLMGEGVAQDLAEARKWIEKAAAGGGEQAIRVLAEGYAHGGLGLSDAERTSERGAPWIKLAAEQGYLPMMEFLASLYEKGGMGLQPNAEEAAKLRARIAAADGSKDKQEQKKGRRRFFSNEK